MLEKLLKEDRRLRIDYKKLLSSGFINHFLLKTTDNYLKAYSKYYNLNTENILRRYNKFLFKYLKDIENFSSMGKYPHLFEKNRPVEQIDYNISLILSIVFSIHRHRIMTKLIEYSLLLKGKILMIGLGSGIELELLNVSVKKFMIDAYDISIDDFVKNRFKKIINIIEDEYSGDGAPYDHIVAIEILEHLKNPYDFLLMCSNSLNNKGTLITTTATNIPQFDHLYNFNDDNDFDQNIRDIGFVISAKEDISHNYMINKIDAKNTWYVLKKTAFKD